MRPISFFSCARKRQHNLLRDVEANLSDLIRRLFIGINSQLTTDSATIKKARENSNSASVRASFLAFEMPFFREMHFQKTAISSELVHNIKDIGENGFISFSAFCCTRFVTGGIINQYFP